MRLFSLEFPAPDTDELFATVVPGFSFTDPTLTDPMLGLEVAGTGLDAVTPLAGLSCVMLMLGVGVLVGPVVGADWGVLKEKLIS